MAVLEWRYWAGEKLGGVGTVAKGRIKAVAIGSNCWVGCGGLYKLSCYSSLALVNEEGKANRVCMDGACADGVCDPLPPSRKSK